jgi:hypothetical protein
VLFLWDCITIGWPTARIVYQTSQAAYEPPAEPQPPIYEVGSPEYNAQVISAIHALNEQLAPQGKRIPERAAIDIIHRTVKEYGQPGGSDH